MFCILGIFWFVFCFCLFCNPFCKDMDTPLEFLKVCGKLSHHKIGNYPQQFSQPFSLLDIEGNGMSLQQLNLSCIYSQYISPSLGPIKVGALLVDIYLAFSPSHSPLREQPLYIQACAQSPMIVLYVPSPFPQLTGGRDWVKKTRSWRSDLK